jgi:hypothetical protein
MPDIVVIDWSLWREASEETISHDTRNMYECIYPVIYEGGWPCRGSHGRESCAVHNVTHTMEWLQLQDVVRKKQCPTNLLSESIRFTTAISRQTIMEDNQKAEKIMDLMLTAGDQFTEATLRGTLMACD